MLEIDGIVAINFVTYLRSTLCTRLTINLDAVVIVILHEIHIQTERTSKSRHFWKSFGRPQKRNAPHFLHELAQHVLLVT